MYFNVRDMLDIYVWVQKSKKNMWFPIHTDGSPAWNHENEFRWFRWWMDGIIYEGFLKYLKLGFNGSFRYKPTSLGCPIYGHPHITICDKWEPLKKENEETLKESSVLNATEPSKFVVEIDPFIRDWFLFQIWPFLRQCLSVLDATLNPPNQISLDWRLRVPPTITLQCFFCLHHLQKKQ